MTGDTIQHVVTMPAESEGLNWQLGLKEGATRGGLWDRSVSQS